MKRLLLATTLIFSQPSLADEQERVPLLENFPLHEIIIDGAIATWMVVEMEYKLAGDVFDEPLIHPAGPGSFDRWFSDLASSPEGDRLHHRIPETITYVFSLGAGAYFAFEAVTTWITGASLIEGNANADHFAFAYMEAYLWSQTLATTCQHLIGRRRPYVDKGLVSTHDQGWNPESSFYSGHASNTFFSAAFTARYLGDLLERTLLSDYSPQAKFWLGRFLPSTVLYGLAGYASYSRIYEQQHYFTDVLTGAILATFFGNLAYSLHFEDGRPRRRSGDLKLIPAGPGGGAGLTLLLRF